MEKLPSGTTELKSLTFSALRKKDHALLDHNLVAQRPRLLTGEHYKTPIESLGGMDCLPLELLHAVLLILDLRTLTDFRYVNRRAKEVTGSMPQYRAVSTHARTALTGILKIETGRWITCETLYKKLCTGKCEKCGDFGGYLYLLTCKRACFLCFSNDRKYLPLLVSEAVRKFGLQGGIVETLPQMISLPGIYSHEDLESHQRYILTDYESACLAGIAFHGSASAMRQHVADNVGALELPEDIKTLSETIAEGSRFSTVRVGWPQIDDPFDDLDGKGNPFRYMATVRTPWLNTASQDSQEPQELEWGFHCVGCHNAYPYEPPDWRRIFNVESFIAHLTERGRIIDGQHWLD